MYGWANVCTNTMNLKTVVICVLFFCGCTDRLEKKEAYRIGSSDCKKMPSFVKTTPLNSGNVAFTTSDKKNTGVLLMDYQNGKTWAHPTWDQYGNFGQLSISNTGKVYLAPIPVVNVASEPELGFNTIFQINPTTGVLEPFIQLSPKQEYHIQNPFGLLGLTFDCSSNVLYATSVYGSTNDEENGCIYAIDVSNKKVIDQYKGIDGFGCVVSGITGEKRLYFGSARTSDIFSIELSRKGTFIGNHQKDFSIDLLGPRGDDKAKKIVCKNNKIQITGYEFNYNLVAPTESQQTKFHFSYNKLSNSWEIN